MDHYLTGLIDLDTGDLVSGTVIHDDLTDAQNMAHDLNRNLELGGYVFVVLDIDRNVIACEEEVNHTDEG